MTGRPKTRRACRSPRPSWWPDDRRGGGNQQKEWGQLLGLGGIVACFPRLAWMYLLRATGFAGRASTG
jgi:hypothetical protein